MNVKTNNKSNNNKSNIERIKKLVFKSGPVGVYQMVLDGTLSKFPNGFWSMPERGCIKVE